MCLLSIVFFSEIGVFQKADCRVEVTLASVLELPALTRPSLEEPWWAHFRQGQPVVGGQSHVMSLGCLGTVRHFLPLECMVLGTVSLEEICWVCLSYPPLHLILNLVTFHQRVSSAWQHVDLQPVFDSTP